MLNFSSIRGCSQLAFDNCRVRFLLKHPSISRHIFLRRAMEWTPTPIRRWQKELHHIVFVPPDSSRQRANIQAWGKSSLHFFHARLLETPHLMRTLSLSAFFASKTTFHSGFFAFLLAVSAAPHAAEEPASAQITVGRGAQYPLCQDYAEQLRQHRVTSGRYCGVAIPLENPDYRLPQWEPLNPAEHMQIVREIYYWRNLNSSRDHELYPQQMRDLTVIVPELFDLYLPRVESQLQALIANDELELFIGRFDVDFDGEIESVYRMTTIGRDRGAISPTETTDENIIVSSSCQEFGLPGASSRYVHYVAPEELPPRQAQLLVATYRLEVREFFYWKSRIYWASNTGRAILEPHALDFDDARQVCGISIRR